MTTRSILHKNIRQQDHSPQKTFSSRSRLSAMLLAVAGITFAVYPALRPFSDEASLQGAAAFASVEWLIAHLLAIFAFILLTFGLYGVYVSLRKTSAERTAFYGLVLSWLGTGLTLPFYGAEVFGLHVIGQETVRQQNVELLELANQIRFGPGFIIIIIGLLLLAVGMIMVATAIWKTHVLPKWSGVPLAVGFLLYLPQFAATQPLRVAHGLLLTAGCLWVAVCLLRNISRGGER
ncbi:hypothetical protein [Paenibacillus sp. An7]|uniref:hypothetical protein n=1 Tax=Paenibacillus sp. An7 TaxID=2689577 RepID=UPI00135714A2|nr:hypothetical protein [Paenibacillus sp. An7]